MAVIPYIPHRSCKIGRGPLSGNRAGQGGLLFSSADLGSVKTTTYRPERMLSNMFFLRKEKESSKHEHGN